MLDVMGRGHCVQLYVHAIRQIRAIAMSALANWCLISLTFQGAAYDPNDKLLLFDPNTII